MRQGYDVLISPTSGIKLQGKKVSMLFVVEIGANTHTVVNIKEENWSAILPLAGCHFVYIGGLKDGMQPSKQKGKIR